MVGAGPSPKKTRDRWWWLLGRILIVVLILIALALLVANRTAPDASRAARGAALDLAAPLLDVAGAPVRGFGAASDWISSYVNAREKSRALERDNARLRTIAEDNRQLLRDNERLRALLKVSEPKADVIGVARVVGASAGGALYSAVITRGSGRGVAIGQPVRDPEGLVGRVIEMGDHSARVLLVTDNNSRVPVKIERTGHSGIALGVNGRFLHLLYVDPDAELKTGDRLLTSGQGGLFPPGIPVGTIVALGQGEPLARPAARMLGLDYVLIMRRYVEAPLVPPLPSQQAITDEQTVAAGAAPSATVQP
jgi:rod shape-determining protein MreC